MMIERPHELTTLATLDEAIEAMQAHLERARAAHEVPLAQWHTSAANIVSAVYDVRRMIEQWAERVGPSNPKWESREELEQLATTLAEQFHEQQANAWRKALEDLASQLESAEVINHRNQRPIPALNTLRQRVVAELRTAAQGNEPCLLPKADGDHWLGWAWGLSPTDALQLLEPLAPTLPLLHEFLGSVNPEDWRPQQASPAPPEPPPPSPPTPTPLPPVHVTIEPPPVAVQPVTPAPSEKEPDRIGVPTMRRAAFLKSLLPQPRTTKAANHKPAPPRPTPTVAETPVLPVTPPPPPAVEPVPETVDDIPLAMEVVDDGATNLAAVEFDETFTEIDTLGPPLDEPLPTFEPAYSPLEPLAPTPTLPVPSTSMATDHEIISCCLQGEFLRAALLAYGREVADQTDFDPNAQALLVTHHVLQQSEMAPWPDWSHDPAAASVAIAHGPQSAQFVYLAAQYHATLSGLDPLANDVSGLLLDSFNDVSTVRQFLALLEEIKCVPGLLEQIRTREPSTDPKAEYQRDRAALIARTSRANQLRPQAAYHHRQDQFLNRMAGGRKLLQLLTEGSPLPAARGSHPDIEEFLTQMPSKIVEDWWHTTRVNLQGDDRIHLRAHAAEYLKLANNAWQSARKLLASGNKRDDVDNYRKQFVDLAPKTREQANAKRWANLWERLLGGLGL